MPVIDLGVSDLLDISAVMRFVTDELVANHNFVARFGDVNGTAVFTGTDTLRWVERPSAETFYGDGGLTLGMRDSPTVRSQDSTPIDLGLQVSHEPFATWDPAAGDRWDDATMDSSAAQYFPPPQATTSPGASLAAPCGVSGLGAGPYVRGRMITSPDSQSITPNEPLYFYIVIEGVSSVYRKFGFGEICKFRDDWLGGPMVMGDIWGTSGANDLDSTTNSMFGSGHYTTSPHVVNRDEASHYIYAPGWTGAADTNANEGRGWMVGQSVDVPGGGVEQRPWPALGWDVRGPLGFMRQSPSGFSLQSERNPAVIWGGNQRLHATVGFEIHPMGVFSDLFQAVVADVDAFGVFTDGGENFMVVPHRNKEIAFDAPGGSGSHGILIRNPALVVTI